MFLLCLKTVEATAQSSPNNPSVGRSSKPEGGAVRGTVLDADTRRPLRFALIMLERRRNPASPVDTGQIAIAGRADANGNFSIADVPPGDYFALAIFQGYTSERDRLQAAVNSGTDPAQLFSRFPLLSVVSGGVSETILTLEHGSSLAGTAHWDDGSPAVSVAVSAIPAAQKKPKGLPAPLDQIEFPLGSASQPITDDQGNFRIPGLPPGEYLVQGALQVRFDSQGRGHAPSDSIYIKAYAPGTLSKQDAKVFHLMTGESRSDVNLVLSLDGMRSVTGQVVGAGEGTPPVTAGQLTLIDTQNPELEYRSSLSTQGEFRFPDVPSGTYDLKIEGAHNDAMQYAEYGQSLIVGNSDLTALRIILTPRSQSAP
ncbi:hypothetical protein [Granulicella arctica]|uniref:Carboxypeptidase regulatory-like domain-containing protein n=1 Tax=Granulicella arctica TaxID=940613 RepID=A0A7Y9PI05_9BACT|nr:hypothetical protein [Granulicella arctica]NYF80272.1 hypothetical protein [Granulicella arctica]